MTVFGNWKSIATALLIFGVIVGVMAVLYTGQCMKSFSIHYAILPLKIKGNTYKYSLWNGLEKLKEDKLWCIYTLILFFSGILPHIKMCLVLFFVSCRIDPAVRVRYVRWVAAIGKWAFVDIWVVVMICVITRLNGSFTILNMKVQVFLQLIALDGAGIYFIGTVLSQLTTMVALLWCKNSSNSDLPFTSVPSEDINYCLDDDVTNARNSSEDNKISSRSSNSLQKSIQECMLERSCMFCRRIRKSACGRWVLSTAVSFVLVMYVLCVIYMPLFEVSLHSFKEILTSEKFSIYSAIAAVATGGTPDQDSPGGDEDMYLNVALGNAAFAFVIVLPVFHQISLLVLWLLPLPVSMMTTKLSYHYCPLFEHASVLSIIEGILDWASHFTSLEPFFVSAVIVAIEISPLIQRSRIGKYVTVEMNLLDNIYIFAVLTVVAAFVRHALMQSIRDVSFQIKNELIHFDDTPAHISNAAYSSDSESSSHVQLIELSM